MSSHPLRDNTQNDRSGGPAGLELLRASSQQMGVSEIFDSCASLWAGSDGGGSGRGGGD